MSPHTPPSPAKLLARPLVVDVLLALSEEPRHGYSLMKHLQNEGSGPVHTGPLYRSLKTLLDAGLIEETDGSEGQPTDDARRGSTYALSAAGREALADELSRLRGLVERGRRLGLAGP